MSRDWYVLHNPTHHQLFKRGLNGSHDVEVKNVLQLSRYQTSSEALSRALEVKVAYKSSRTCYKVSIAETQQEENNVIVVLDRHQLQEKTHNRHVTEL
ncbi:hypothetical protein Zmor_018215 [Zophobas morio]|uniref:Uncharacterized protein n=1 Tax=Zophobas morio TaxID=2755281 RepID=A0AA38IBN6_9CUCU|nr:hypothetical protein Zmor_018215 [Zophobas morio]